MSLMCQIWVYLRCTTGCFDKCMHYENITAVKLNNLSITSAQLPCVCVCVCVCVYGWVGGGDDHCYVHTLFIYKTQKQ